MATSASKADLGTGKARLSLRLTIMSPALAALAPPAGRWGRLWSIPLIAHNVVVRLNEIVCNRAFVTVTLNDVTDDQGHTLDSASVTFGVLFGDVTADGVVDDADIAAVRAVQGQRTNNSNFRADITADGGINFKDVGEAKKYRGNTLP